jgi:hypothetical protein
MMMMMMERRVPHQRGLFYTYARFPRSSVEHTLLSLSSLEGVFFFIVLERVLMQRRQF